MSDTTSERNTASANKTGDKAGQVVKPSAQAARRPSGGAAPAYASLSTDMGTTHISEAVVAKIAGMATREIPGVHSMGRGMARRLGRVRAMVPGQTDSSMVAQGVEVEVGEKEAAIDLDIVTWYGQSIIEISEAVRRNVIERVESMTGLRVVEVNINVDDIYIEGQEEKPPEKPRVQ
ncbi:Asp23/Gls24 family envelope stress response protein [Actinomadura sp. HBU206391]|uniref:Asp23/Gls24 family envelope stress response protein n=1 Tax=Actinomadura sp. HBU206391 TaxID=2731692 RepID=UPI001650B283|nr:Asp23/Gls24 family envelope stress response protein [Actinomadura sp. HBU206391]MBC6457365.1 Asp23/Gls24 family envelope stress response protein [Actinomadura sp. HBU206391]